MSELLRIETSSRPAKLTAAEFDLLEQHGAFAAYHKSELIDGRIYVMNSQLRPHGMVKMRLHNALRDALLAIRSPYISVTEITIALSATDLPEPDILLTNEPDGVGYVPLASVPLVIEVSDSTLATDLKRKMRRYAAAGISEYWVADVNARVIHQMWAPAGRGYGASLTHAFGDDITARAVAGLAIGTTEL